MKPPRESHPRRTVRWSAAALALVAAAVLAPVTVKAACCYFAAKDRDIDQPGQKAFIAWDPVEKIESFTVQPRFAGNAADFGMVIPTPTQPKLHEMPRDFFTDLALYTILLPLPEPIYPYLIALPEAASAGGGGWRARGGKLRESEDDGGVVVLEAGVVGSLDYKIIVADDAKGLYRWLDENGYAYSGDESTLGFYIDKGWFFTVMKIDPQQMKRAGDGSYLGEVTPTRFTFASEQCVYPLKITQISVKDSTDALLYVQAPEQMDLEGDLSWRPSFRSMYLTFRVGCGATEEEQEELAQHQRWLDAKRAKDPAFETTKLEWARHLTEADLAVCEDPARNYAQMAGGDLPPGVQRIRLDSFLDAVWKEYRSGQPGGDESYAKQRLAEMRALYAEDKGMIVVVDKPGGFLPTRYMWLPDREAPADEIAGLTRLKGHLRRGHWITKIRKVIRRDEMNDDLVLVPVAAARQQEYVRILPTSPP